MTEQEFKDFFILSPKDEITYNNIRNTFSEEQLAESLQPLVTELLKKTYGFPISFMDEGKEELFTASEQKSQEVYENYAQEILDDYYEDLYDFTQELSDCFRNFPD